MCILCADLGRVRQLNTQHRESGEKVSCYQIGNSFFQRNGSDFTELNDSSLINAHQKLAATHVRLSGWWRISWIKDQDRQWLEGNPIKPSRFMSYKRGALDPNALFMSHLHNRVEEWRLYYNPICGDFLLSPPTSVCMHRDTAQAITRCEIGGIYVCAFANYTSWTPEEIFGKHRTEGMPLNFDWSRDSSVSKSREKI